MLCRCHLNGPTLAKSFRSFLLGFSSWYGKLTAINSLHKVILALFWIHSLRIGNIAPRTFNAGFTFSHCTRDVHTSSHDGEVEIIDEEAFGDADGGAASFDGVDAVVAGEGNVAVVVGGADSAGADGDVG